MNKKNLILASVSAIIFTSILIIFSPNSQKLSLSSPTPSPVPTESISPTPDPTADWKTYENDKFGFSLKYPQNLKPIINSTNQTTIVEFINDASNNSTNSVFHINYMENPNNLSIPDFYKELTNKSDMFVANPFTATIKPESIQVDSHPGFRFITPGVLFNDVVSILLSNKTILGINRTIYEKNTIDEPNKKVFDQILSTFKFTDNTAVIPSSITTFYTAVNSYFKSNIAIIPEKQFYFSQGMIDKPSWSLDISKVDKEKGLVGDVFINQFNMEIGPGGGDQGGGGRVEFVNDKLDCYYSTGYNSTGGQETWNDSNSFSNILCTEK